MENAEFATAPAPVRTLLKELIPKMIVLRNLNPLAALMAYATAREPVENGQAVQSANQPLVEEPNTQHLVIATAMEIASYQPAIAKRSDGQISTVQTWSVLKQTRAADR